MTKEKTKNNKRMIERYRNMNRFKYGIFRVCNPAIPTEVRENSILAGIVLDKLKELKKEIQEDIEAISITSIDIEDILGSVNSEISELLAREICLFDLAGIKNQYENYLKAERLNSIFPLADRENRIKELEKQINNLKLTIDSLEEIEPSLALTQKEKVKNLLKEKDALEETLHFISLDDIKANLFVRLHSFLLSLLNDFDDKIDFIERNM